MVVGHEGPEPQLAAAIEAAARPADEGGYDGGYEAACTRLLHLLRRHVGMEVGWTSEFLGSDQVFRIVDSDDRALAPPVGARTPLSDAYCSRVLNGTMPPLIPNAQDEPLAVWLDVTFALHIGSYLGVPLHGTDGTPNGMLCLISRGPSPALDERALTTARLVAQVVDDLHHRVLGEDAVRRERADLHARLTRVCSGEGRDAVFQPIVDLGTGSAVAVEALTRFADPCRTTAGWFAAAQGLGLGRELEVAAARSALRHLADDGGPQLPIAVNLSPDVVVQAMDDVFAGVEVSRVVLELTEHRPVADYDELERVLAPYRAAGLRVAVDDTGAGYASMSHVLRLRPDLLKIDMSLVRDVDADPVRQALIGALVRFGAVAGVGVVAEGIETRDELAALVELGVRLGQGYYLERPSARAVDLPRGAHRPAEHGGDGVRGRG